MSSPAVDKIRFVAYQVRRFLVSVTATGLFLGSIYADRQHTLRWRTQQEEARKRVIDLTGLTREQLGE